MTGEAVEERGEQADGLRAARRLLHRAVPVRCWCLTKGRVYARRTGSGAVRRHRGSGIDRLTAARPSVERNTTATGYRRRAAERKNKIGVRVKRIKQGTLACITIIVIILFVRKVQTTKDDNKSICSEQCKQQNVGNNIKIQQSSVLYNKLVDTQLSDQFPNIVCRVGT